MRKAKKPECLSAIMVKNGWQAMLWENFGTGCGYVNELIVGLREKSKNMGLEGESD